MFISQTSAGYDRHGQQYATGRFLILMHDKDEPMSAPIRALVRVVRLSQLGQFMMGIARVGKHKISLSGAYGHDGLTCDVPREVYERGVELPQELRELWSKGCGWNGAGSEANTMREWALNTFPVRKR